MNDAPGLAAGTSVWFEPPADAPDTAALSADERDRISRIRAPDERRLRETAWALAREVLGAWTRTPPDQLRFRRGAHGKPHLDGPVVPWFNLAHTRGLVALAVSDEGPVGIDVERLERGPVDDAIARRSFTSRERRELLRGSSAVDPGATSVIFLQTWTRKEAVVKAVGVGLSMPLRRLHVGSTGTVVCRAADTAFCVRSLRAPTGYVAALASGTGPVVQRGAVVARQGPA